MKISNKGKNYQGYLVAFYIVTTIAMYYISNNQLIVSQIAYVILGIVFIISPININVIFLFCLFPFPRLFLINHNFYTLVPLLEIIIVAKYILNRKITKNSMKLLILGLLILTYSAIVEYYRFSTISTSIEYCIKLLVVIVICEINDEKTRKICYTVLCIGIVVSAIGGYISPSLHRFTAMYSAEFISRAQGMLTDPGTFGQILVCAMSCAIALLFQRNDNRRIGFKRIVGTIMFCFFCLYFIIQSGTRASLIGVVVIYIVVIYWLVNKKNKGVQLIGYFTVVLSVIFAESLASALFNAVSATHGGGDVLSDSRFEIWQNYWNVYRNDPSIIIFGVGMESCNRLGSQLGIGNPHNIIIEKIFESGVIGLVLNIMFFYEVVKRKIMRISEKTTLPFYVFLSTLFVYGVAGSEIPYCLLSLINEKSYVKQATNTSHVDDNERENESS